MCPPAPTLSCYLGPVLRSPSWERQGPATSAPGVPSPAAPVHQLGVGQASTFGRSVFTQTVFIIQKVLDIVCVYTCVLLCLICG